MRAQYRQQLGTGSGRTGHRVIVRDGLRERERGATSSPGLVKALAVSTCGQTKASDPPGIGFRPRSRNRHQLARPRAATSKRSGRPVVRKLQKPEAAPVARWSIPRAAFSSKLPPGQISCHPAVSRSVVAGTRCRAPSGRSPLPRMNRQMVQNAVRGRGGDQGPSRSSAPPPHRSPPAWPVRLEHPQNPRDTPAPSRAPRPRRCPPASRKLLS